MFIVILDSPSLTIPANCGLPVFPRNGYGQIYLDSNTMEGARVLFICSNDVQHSLEQAHVAVCNPDGKWKPNPGNFCSGMCTDAVHYHREYVII